MKSLILGALAATALFAGEASAQGYCREYSQGVSIGGQRQSSYGVACLQPDGSWQIVSSQQGYNGGYGGGSYDYNYTPPPAPVYVPTPVPVYRPTSTFSLSFGVPYYRGRGDCDDRRWGWGGGGHHGHHGHGWKHGRW